MQTVFKISVLLLLGSLAFAGRAAEVPAVVNELKINVRGQPSLVGEVVTQLEKGDPVTVLEFVENDRAKPGEPTNWAKIKLPANTPVWVYGSLVKDGVVTASRLNLRAGPGENYSVIGRVDRGETVKPIRTQGDWVEIEAPTVAYAFIDATLVTPLEGNAPVATPANTAASATPPPGQPEPAPAINAITTNTVAQAPETAEPVPTNAPTAELVTNTTQNTTQAPKETQIAARPVENPNPAQDALASPTLPDRSQDAAPISTPQPAAPLVSVTRITPPASNPSPATPTSGANLNNPSSIVAPAPKPEAAPVRRIVRREGIVRPTVSIQAPTWYELIHPETKKTIDYLHEEKVGLKLKQFKGQKVIVSGEESVDPRWPNTPILEIETLDIAP